MNVDGNFPSYERQEEIWNKVRTLKNFPNNITNDLTTKVTTHASNVVVNITGSGTLVGLILTGNYTITYQIDGGDIYQITGLQSYAKFLINREFSSSLKVYGTTGLTSAVEYSLK